MRALQVIPGGIYGHQSPELLTQDKYPFFLAEGQGARVRDVDGNSYIDFLCGYGPVVLGHRHPKVEEAAAQQRDKIDTASLPAAVYVQAAERLVDMTAGMDWAVFCEERLGRYQLGIGRGSGRDRPHPCRDGARHLPRRARVVQRVSEGLSRRAAGRGPGVRLERPGIPRGVVRRAPGAHRSSDRDAVSP